MSVELTKLKSFANKVQPEYPEGEAAYDLIDYQSPQLQLTAPAPVWHNFLHGIESVYWVYLWTILALINYRLSNDYTINIFHTTFIVSMLRGETLTNSLIAKLEHYLHPMLQATLQPLNITHNKLYNAFQKLKDPSELSVYSPLYGALLRLIEETEHLVKMEEVPFCGLNSLLISANASLKRSFSKIGGIISELMKKKHT